MSHLKTITTIGLMLLVSTVNADYQNEISILNMQSDGSIGTEHTEGSGTLLAYAYYLEKIDTSTGPWQLASFMQRSGFISFWAATQESTYNKSNSDYRDYYLTAQISNRDSPFVFGFSYGKGNSDTTGYSTTYSSDSKDYGLSLGYYVQPYTLVALDYSKSKTEYSYTHYPFESKTNGISVSSVLLREAGTAVALSAGYHITKYQTGTEFKFTTLSADYFLNPRLGIGMSISTFKSNYDVNNRKTLGLSASYYINPQFEISASYSKDKADTEQGIEIDFMLLSGSFYF